MRDLIVGGWGWGRTPRKREGFGLARFMGQKAERCISEALGAPARRERETEASCLRCGINYAVNQQMSAAPCRLKPPSGKGDVIRLMYGLGLGVL